MEQLKKISHDKSGVNLIYYFVSQKVTQLDKDDPGSRAACARLRRAVGKPPGATPDVWEFTLQGAPSEWDSLNGKPSYAEWAVHTALTLYALHRQGKDRSMNAEKVSFGAAAACLVQRDENRLEAVRRRFNSVATAVDFTEMAHNARGLVLLFKSEDVAMDYPQFANDLFQFQLPGGGDRIRLRWGEDFYQFKRISEDEPQTTTKTKGRDEE